MMTLPSFRARPIVLVPINATYGVGQMLFDAVFKRLADRSRDRSSATQVLYRVSEGLTHRRRTRRHAGEGRYPRLSLLRQTEVVDAGLRRHDEGASPKSRSFGDPVLRSSSSCGYSGGKAVARPAGHAVPGAAFNSNTA